MCLFCCSSFEQSVPDLDVEGQGFVCCRIFVVVAARCVASLVASVGCSWGIVGDAATLTLVVVVVVAGMSLLMSH